MKTPESCPECGSVTADIPNEYGDGAQCDECGWTNFDWEQAEQPVMKNVLDKLGAFTQ